MISAWMPTAKELAQLNEGFPILLHILGEQHPVVGMSIASAADA
jgi:hypothetical protein